MKLSIADDGRSDRGAAQLQDNEALHYQVQTGRGSRYHTIRQFPLRCPPVAESKVPSLGLFLNSTFQWDGNQEFTAHLVPSPGTCDFPFGTDLITRDLSLPEVITEIISLESWKQGNRHSLCCLACLLPSSPSLSSQRDTIVCFISRLDFLADPGLVLALSLQVGTTSEH